MKSQTSSTPEARQSLCVGVATIILFSPGASLPALVAGNFSYLIPYLIGIFGGGILAGQVQTQVVKTE
jgi:mannitol-specific phosphotransferase system IIBC component